MGESKAYHSEAKSNKINVETTSIQLWDIGAQVSQNTNESSKDHFKTHEKRPLSHFVSFVIFVRDISKSSLFPLEISSFDFQETKARKQIFVGQIMVQNQGLTFF